jgi:hypothetical protein
MLKSQIPAHLHQKSAKKWLLTVTVGCKSARAATDTGHGTGHTLASQGKIVDNPHPFRTFFSTFFLYFSPG